MSEFPLKMKIVMFALMMIFMIGYSTIFGVKNSVIGMNLLVNRKKDYRLSKATLHNLVSEINNAIDLRLSGENVSRDSFEVADGFYLSIFSRFEYKYFPNSRGYQF